MRILTLGEEKHLLYIGGLAVSDGAWRDVAGIFSTRTTAVPVVDISWDAREAGKLAHYAAAAGVYPEEPDPATAAIAQETEERYMIAFDHHVDPRDVTLGPETA